MGRKEKNRFLWQKKLEYWLLVEAVSQHLP